MTWDLRGQRLPAAAGPATRGTPATPATPAAHATPATPAVLEMRHVTFRYDSAPDIPVLNRFSLAVNPGELLCILGPSGCGKSTVLKVAGSFLLPSSGEVLVDGTPVDRPDARRVMVFQDHDQLFPWKTVAGNVQFGLRGRHSDVVAALLREVGLAQEGHRYPHELSGGMRQRVALARALAGRPPVLLLDEPFAAVDAPQRRELQVLLQTLLRDHGTTAVFVTHDVEEALRLGSRIIVLDRQARVVLEEEGAGSRRAARVARAVRTMGQESR